jgi:hypothetical protein
VPNFETVKQYVQALQLVIVREDPAEALLLVEDEARGLKNLVIDCEEPLVVFEQTIMTVSPHDEATCMRLLQMNRTLVHGAFVLNEEGTLVLFRDTLQLAHLDVNEVEGTLDALSLALVEHGEELIVLSRRGV